MRFKREMRKWSWKNRWDEDVKGRWKSRKGKPGKRRSGNEGRVSRRDSVMR